MHASIYFEVTKKELLEELEQIRANTGLAFFGDKTKSAIEAINEVLDIMKRAIEKNKVVLDLPSAQREKILKDILKLAELLKKVALPNIDSNEWTKLIDNFLRNLPKTEGFTGVNNVVERLRGQLLLGVDVSIFQTVKKIGDLLQDLEKRPIVFRDKKRDELTQIEDEALAKIEIVEKVLAELAPERYESYWKKKLEIIKANILLRRKKVKASYAHPEIGGDEVAWMPVAVFLDMLSYPFYYPDVMNYVKVHDYKFIVPDKFEAKIAKDADLLDGIGPDAVVRTYHVGRSFGNVYFKPDLPLDARFEYLRTGTKSPDTVSVILSLCFDWPKLLSTQAARAIVRKDQKVEKMIKELKRFSREEEKLTVDEMEILERVIKEYERESLRQVELQKQKAAQLSEEELMHNIWYE